MRSRFLFLALTLFWLAMNFLLWRSEFVGREHVGSAVSLDLVLDKVLTAPDPSSLEIYHHGKKIGFCRLAASVGMEASKKFSEDFAPEGMVAQPTNYKLDLEGNVTFTDSTNRLRFEMDFKLSTNRVWQEFNLRAHLRPAAWELHASAAEKKVRFVVDDVGDRWEQSFTFEQLRHPQTLLQEFGGPVALTIFGALGNLGLNATGDTNAPPLSFALQWQANNDFMRFGHSKVRVYRLYAKALGRFEIFIFVSRVGEILWVELPDQLILSNDAFTHF